MASGQIYKGKNLRILVGGLPVYHATSCSLSVTSSTDEVETKDTTGTIVTPGNTSYTLSTDALVAEGPSGATHVDTFQLLQHQINQDELTFQFTDSVVGNKVLSGSIFVVGIDLTSDVGSNATGSHSFTGNGDLLIDTVV